MAKLENKILVGFVSRIYLILRTKKEHEHWLLLFAIMYITLNLNNIFFPETATVYAGSD